MAQGGIQQAPRYQSPVPSAAKVATVPWMDCTGEGFATSWDSFYTRAAEAFSGSRPSLGAHGAVEMLLNEDYPVLPGRAEAATGARIFRDVLTGDGHPKDLVGFCLLGVAAARYLQGLALLRAKPRLARLCLEESYHLLVQPLGLPVAFDFLEGSRWGRLASTRDLLLALAVSREPARSAAAAPQLAAGGLHPISCLGAAASPAPRTGNLTVAALSTHAAVLEPVATLRAQLQQRGVGLVARYLALMHPSGTLPCELAGQKHASVCSGVLGWGSDVRTLLHPLGNMADPRYRDEGFMVELIERMGLVYSRHIHGRVDFVICAHPFLLCALLRPLTALFMLVYLTPTPLTLVPPGPDRTWVLSQLSALAQHRTTALLAASPIYALHAQFQTGAGVPVARPCALYVAEDHQWRSGMPNSNLIHIWLVSGLMAEFLVVAQNFVVYSRQTGVLPQELQLSFKELLGEQIVTWGHLATVRCVVLLPWDLQLTIFPELYALGVPLILPSTQWIAFYALRILAGHGGLFWAVSPEFAGQLPTSRWTWAACFPFEPWLHQGWDKEGPDSWLRAEAQLLHWLQVSDFETFGHTLRFESVPEMLSLAAAPVHVLAETATAMRAEWQTARIETAQLYEQVASQLLG